MRMPPRCLWIVLLSGLLPAAARAGGASPKDFEPDPRSVQRYGPAYRYPQAGWIVLHVEGEPYQRGYQHGRLLAPEILAYVRCFAALQSPKAPSEGWKLTRTLVDSLFLRRYDREYLEEMKGIAAGASDAGARYDGRPLDLADIAALNSWAEIDTLGAALRATPTGLEGLRLGREQPQPMPPAQETHCSAFAATGPATADGKIVFGHITMFGLYPSGFFNVWLDLKPARGHRVLMQSYPGGIQSGLDYYLNDAGLLVCETTLAQTRFDITGQALASRIRRALQYADSIDAAVEILGRENNGLYTNEWLLADVKTNEIAMFELGTHKTKLYRSSKNEWFGGTEGFYWGCNNTKDLEVRLETAPGVDGRPANMVFRPSDRDRKWQELYARYKGRIDADFGKLAFTTPPLAAYHSVDAKFTTSDMAKELKTWALYGPPLGRSWQPTRDEILKFPDLRPLASNPWTVLHAQPPAREQVAGPTAVDLHDLRTPADRGGERSRDEEQALLGEPAWHGTLLPHGDADVWLAAAFADYEHLVALERARQREASAGGRPHADERDEAAARRNAYRSSYLAAARVAGDVPLGKTRADVAHDEWYRIAADKGVLLLHDLHQLMGDSAFTDMMDAFGREHAGKPVTAAEFVAHAEKTGKVPAGFFRAWLDETGLPTLRLGRTTVIPEKGKPGAFLVQGELLRSGDHPAPAVVELTVETAQGEITKTLRLQGAATPFSVRTEAVPRRVVADKYGSTARANGAPYTVFSFEAEVEQALIVYGTADEAAANREAAEALQRAIVQRWSNYTVPVKSDREVTPEELRTHHLLLIGRPDCNRIVEQVRGALPVHFGSRSFVVRGEVYAHADSAVVAAAANPLNPRYSVTVVAGLGAAATLRAAPFPHRGEQTGAEVLVLAHGARPHALVIPPPELVQEFQGR